jgi:hypothetical protein
MSLDIHLICERCISRRRAGAVAKAKKKGRKIPVGDLLTASKGEDKIDDPDSVMVRRDASCLA